MKQIIKNILDFFRTHLPIELFYIYHWFWAIISRLIYGNLSNKLILLGVMGAKGKSTTANLIWQINNSAGIKTGIISTNMIGVGDITRNNEYHKTLPGRHHTFKLLKEMIQANCKVAVLEIPIEGIPFSRERYLNFDQIIFTNITNEKHRNFKYDIERAKEYYRKPLAKLVKSKVKRLYIANTLRTIKKYLIYNLDREELQEYRNSFQDSHVKSIGYSLSRLPLADLDYYYASEISVNLCASYFKLNFSNKEIENYAHHNLIKLNLGNEINVNNALAAIASTLSLGIPIKAIIKALENLDPIAGRYEIIKKNPYTIIVDYAHEQLSFQSFFDGLMKVLGGNKQSKIIAHISAEGGGRDINKRYPMGEIAGKYADYLILGDCDPYEEDPRNILEKMAKGAEASGKIKGKDLFIIPDREAGFNKCFELAKKGDIVLLLTKGADQGINYKNHIMPWDDRIKARKLCNVNQFIKQNKLKSPVFLFDMDGVLIDSTEYSLQALSETLEHFNLKANQDLMLKLIGTGVKTKYRFLKEHFAKQIDLNEFSYQNYREIFNKISLKHTNYYQAIPGVRNFLERLYKNNYQLGLYTSSSSTRFQLIDDRLNLSQYFDQIVLGEEEILEKPAPDGYLELTKRMQANIKDCLVFEDSNNGIESGLKAGARVIAIGTKFDPKNLPASPEITLRDFRDLEPMIKFLDKNAIKLNLD